MTYQRIFPRYEISKIKGKVKIEGLQSKDISLKDISLGGFKIFYPQEIDIYGFQNTTIQLLDKDAYKLNANQVWCQFSESNNCYMAGFELKFDHKDHYIKWLNTIKAIHVVKQKLKN